MKTRPNGKPWQSGRLRGRGGGMRTLLLLLLEGCTQGVASSCGLVPMAAEGCSTHRWLVTSSAHNGDNCSSKEWPYHGNLRRSNTVHNRMRIPCEGWTPRAAGVLTSCGRYSDGMSNFNIRNSGCRDSPRQPCEGCTTRVATSYGPPTHQTIHEGGTCNPQVAASCCQKPESTRRISSDDSPRRTYEGCTCSWQVVTSYGSRISRMLHEGYTCSWQVVASYGNEAEPCMPVINHSSNEKRRYLNNHARTSRAELHCRAVTGTTPCEGWTPCAARVSTSCGEYSGGNLTIKGGTQLHCVATLFGREHTSRTELHRYTCGNNDTSCPQWRVGSRTTNPGRINETTPCEGWTPCVARVPTSYGDYSDESLTIKGYTQLHCVVTLFGRLHNHVRTCRTELHCNTETVLTDMNYIDEMIADDFMVDDPCLKSQTLTVRMSLRAWDILFYCSPHGWDSRPLQKGHRAFIHGFRKAAV